MASSIGCDIEEIESNLNNTEFRLLNRWFTQRELDEVGENERSIEKLTGKWCAKEAVIKALGGLNKKTTWNEIEILGEAPAVYIKSVPRPIRVSISHCDKYAMAVAIIGD